MRRRRRQAHQVQDATPRKGRDTPAGKVTRSERSKRSSRPRSYVILPFGVRVVRRSWCLGLATVVFALVLFGVLLLYSYRQYSEEEAERLAFLSSVDDVPEAGAKRLVFLPSAGDVPNEGAVSIAVEQRNADIFAGSEVLSIQSVLEAHRTATGLVGVHGLILHGRYLEDKRDFVMKLMVKAPGLVRKVLTDAGLNMVCSYDGELASIEIEDPSGMVHEQALSDELYRQAIVLEGAALSLMSNSLPDTLVYQLEADQRYDGRNCWTIRRRVSVGESMIHLIDSETGLEQVRFVYFMHEGRRQQLSLHLSDYREQGAGQLPFAYTLKFNGEVRGEARVDSVQVNPGLMPWMFSAK